MRCFWFVGVAWLSSAACAGSASEDAEALGGPPSSSAGDPSPCGTTTETLPLMGNGVAPGTAATVAAPSPEVSPYVMFIDCATGFSTDEVHDADREIVHFDANLEALVSAASGNSVGGWTVMGADLAWSRNRVPFRVRFGTEAGERRAYFTEAGPGTICNLNVAAPEVLYISATRETPPNP